jgi:hypothetical protein
MMAPAPKGPNPTAVQFETLGHATPFKPLICVGTDWGFQVLPRFAEVTTESTPTATQEVGPWHKTELMFPVPAGGT